MNRIYKILMKKVKNQIEQGSCEMKMKWDWTNEESNRTMFEGWRT
jgi:hypothetical protein